MGSNPIMLTLLWHAGDGAWGFIALAYLFQCIPQSCLRACSAIDLLHKFSPVIFHFLLQHMQGLQSRDVQKPMLLSTFSCALLKMLVW